MARNRLFDYGNGIIRNENVLLETFIPTRLLHHDGQLEALASCLRPVTKERRPRNAFLYGPTGTGKTMCLYIFEQLSSYTGRAKTIYVNCWKSPTTHAILCGLICIANDGHALMNVDPRIKSSLQLDEIRYFRIDICDNFGVLVYTPLFSHRNIMNRISINSNNVVRVKWK